MYRLIQPRDLFARRRRANHWPLVLDKTKVLAIARKIDLVRLDHVGGDRNRFHFLAARDTPNIQ